MVQNWALLNLIKKRLKIREICSVAVQIYQSENFSLKLPCTTDPDAHKCNVFYAISGKIVLLIDSMSGMNQIANNSLICLYCKATLKQSVRRGEGDGIKLLFQLESKERTNLSCR